MRAPGLIRIFVVGLVIGIFVSPAHADGPSPYANWVFDVRKANDANDLNALTQLSAAQPNFARAWFYGQVYDLVNPGVPDAERGILGQRLAQIAGLLRSMGDPKPALFIDRIATGRLATDAVRSRKMVEQWTGLARAGNLLPIRLATVQEPDVARGVFYGLLFRAELASRTLGGRYQSANYLLVARALA